MKISALLFLLVLACPAPRAQDFDRTRAVDAPAPDTLALVSATPIAGLGLVSFREGLLARRPAVNPDWLDAPLRSQVEEGDRVRTGPRGRSEIEFQANNVLRLAPSTTLCLTQLLQEERESALKVDLQLEEGDVWAELNGLDEDDDFTVRSQVMGAAITGTGFRLSVDQDRETVLTVLHGEVRVAADDEGLARDPRLGLSVDSLSTLLQEARPARKGGAPVPVAGPTPVAGPREVSLKEWMIIVKGMQEVRIGADGTVRAAGNISSAGNSAWVRWNLERNKARQTRQGH